MDLASIKQLHGNYWIGPFGIQIPFEVGYILAPDCENDVSWMLCKGEILVHQTENCGYHEPYSEDEYKQQFCQQGADGLWYWRYSTQKESDEAVRAAPPRPEKQLFGGDPDW